MYVLSVKYIYIYLVRWLEETIGNLNGFYYIVCFNEFIYCKKDVCCFSFSSVLNAIQIGKAE